MGGKVSCSRWVCVNNGMWLSELGSCLTASQRNGSSGVAIKKWIGDHYKGKLPANWEKITALQLKSLSSKGALQKVKASYKLGEALKKKKPAAKKAAKPKVAKPKAEGAAKPKVRFCGTQQACATLLLLANPSTPPHHSPSWVCRALQLLVQV